MSMARPEAFRQNDLIARENRKRLEGNRVFSLNLISGPGAGKTTLLERTVVRMRDWTRIAVISGVVHEDGDAERLRRHGVQVEIVETAGGGHLDASGISRALDAIDLPQIDLLFIENVGDLICPAGYDLGETMKVVVLAATEGQDNPLKYPDAFRQAGALVLTKIDLLQHLDFSAPGAIPRARTVNPELLTFPISCYTGEGLEAWTDWLMNQVVVRQRTKPTSARWLSSAEPAVGPGPISGRPSRAEET